MDMTTVDLTDFSGRARAWVRRTYGDLVVLADTEPIRTTDRMALFGCRYAHAREPMLAATVGVPTDGRSPFPVANAEPLDEETNLAWSPEESEPWRWRVNARNSVVAVDSVVDGSPASACAWHPADEAPGWWDRLLSRHFPTVEVGGCSTWAQVGQAIVDGGPGTRGVVWLRRHLAGLELTGHLLYAHHDEETGQATVVDPLNGTTAAVDDREVDSLVLARFHRPIPPPDMRSITPWAAPATDFPAAVAKAESWLDFVYRGQVTLVSPDPADETRRGWLFACTTVRFQETCDWRHQMLDAALVVPKAAGETPFGLPNHDPWRWLREWNAGAVGLPAPPALGEVFWFSSMYEQVGRLRGGTPHPHWTGALEEVRGFPGDSLALIWMRRKDAQDRETVGQLFWAVSKDDEVHVTGPATESGSLPVDDDPFELRVFRIGSQG